MSVSERQIDLFLRTVLQSLEQRILVEEALAGEVGNGAGHPEDAVVGAGRKAQRLVGGPQELFSSGVIRQMRRTCPAVSWALQRTSS